MRPFIQELSRVATVPVSAYPNAGYPTNLENTMSLLKSLRRQLSILSRVVFSTWWEDAVVPHRII